MTTKDLLSALINASEKAANIARECRRNEELFNLLIEEKTGNEKNERFVNDFKTLADVVIQETIKHDIGKLFPAIRENIKGEEGNKFENALNESIIVEIQEDPDETKALLLKVLNGNESAAQALSDEVHKNVSTEDSQQLPDLNESIKVENIGIWIDPIDATSEYITGANASTNIPNIEKTGLKCATVLIGAYDKETNKPIMGIINQPFFQQLGDDGDGHKSKIFWGLSINGENHHNIVDSSTDNTKKVAIISSAETRRPTLESAGELLKHKTDFKVLIKIYFFMLLYLRV